MDKLFEKYKWQMLALLICSISVVAVYGMTKVLFGQVQTNAYPLVEKGVVDLSHMEITNSTLLPLDGEWGYSEGQLLENNKQLQQVHQTNQSQELYVQVPGKWNEYGLKRLKPESFGNGTFHLKILLPSGHQVYAFKIQNIGMAHQVFINGEKIQSSGKPSTKPEDYTIRNVPYVFNYETTQGYLDIFIQVANYDYSPYSGIVSSVYFGTDQAMLQYHVRNHSADWAFISSLFVVGIVFMTLYLYRRKNNHLLFFALYSFSGLIYYMTHGEKVWYQVFPHFEYHLFSRIQYFSAGLNIVMFILYIYFSFPHLFKNLKTKILLFISFILLLPCLFLSLRYQSLFSSFQVLFIQAVIIYSVYGFVLGILKGIENSLIVSLSTLTSLFVVIIAWEIVLGATNMNTPLIVAQTIWILIQSILIAVRLSKAYDEVDSLSKELIIMDKYKDEFLAKTTHEFKTPLNGIINISQLMLEHDEKMAFDQRENLQFVIDIANRLSRLVNDILDISKIREGKIAVEMTLVDVENVLRRVMEIFRVVYDQNAYEIYLEVEEDIKREKAMILSDRDRLKQILINLIENGLKFAKDGKVYIYLRRKASKIEVEIVNFGEGIEKSQYPYIFEPFTQIYKSTDFQEHGAGLGLSIVKDLLELLGGAIEINSEVQRWTSFTVSFAEEKMDSTASVHSGQSSSDNILEFESSVVLETNEDSRGEITLINKPKVSTEPVFYHQEGKETILVLDDHPTNLKILVETLVGEGYSVIAVSTGQGVLNTMDKLGQVDLLILDVMLPDMSGYEVSKEVRKRFSLSELPILFLTAGIQRIDGEKALINGGNDFLYKPFQLVELRSRVKSLLAMKKSASQMANYEIAFLHAQIKPHFLYNALNTIVSVCESSSPEGAELIMSLAKYLRGTLDFSNIDRIVPYEKELALVKAYLKIEMARFSSLQVVYDIEPDIEAVIPPLSLQILVENAVKHGRKDQHENNQMVIAIKRYQDVICFTVKDNGRGMTSDAFEQALNGQRVETSIGLYNLNKRLGKLLGSRLQLFDTLDGTTLGFYIKEVMRNDF